MYVLVSILKRYSTAEGSSENDGQDQELSFQDQSEENSFHKNYFARDLLWQFLHIQLLLFYTVWFVFTHVDR